MPCIPETRLRATAILIAALAATLLASAPAYAGRVSLSNEVLDYDASAGEANRVSVTFRVNDNGRVTATIADSEGISTSGSCRTEGGNRQVATCTSDRDESVRAEIDLGDREDNLRINQEDPARAPAVRIVDGTGDDIITVNNGATTWVNSAGADIYRGGAGRDVALPGEGDDFILAGYGNDSVDGGAGNDQLSGNVGDDRLDGDEGFDLVEGNAGNDDIRGGADGDFVFGGSGNDRLAGDSGYDRLFGGPGSDTVDGSTTVDNRSG